MISVTMSLVVITVSSPLCNIKHIIMEKKKTMAVITGYLAVITARYNICYSICIVSLNKIQFLKNQIFLTNFPFPPKEFATPEKT